MANPNKIVPENIDSDLFVDKSCINCDACRRFAPDNFQVHPEYSFVHQAPSNQTQLENSLMALLSCPVGAIGYKDLKSINPIFKEVRKSFPLEIEKGVFINGYNHRKTFGADSYFLVSEHGNWMVDSPRFNKDLVNNIEKRGGLKYIFLSHQDDIGDSKKYAEYFGAKRIIQKYDSAKASDAEIILDEQEVSFDEGIIIHTPGHTKGSQCLVWKGEYLFTGDHFAWIRRLNQFASFRRACWYSWEEQIESIAVLAKFKNIRWVLPGHGSRGQISKGEFPQIIKKATDWMESVR